MFARVATAYADDADHAQRIYDYISKLWFMPATPVLSNGGADRGLPISCFLNAVPRQPRRHPVGVWNENVALASNGGGIGTYWGGVRSIGEKVKGAGQTSGIIPFIRVMDSLTLAISQGSLRRGSAAVYLDVHHPEIEEFLEIRKPSGDFNRKSLNLHHGISITDEFMEAVRDGEMFGLRSPKTGEVVRDGRRPLAVAEDPRDPPADRRALPDLLRHREPGHAAAPARAGPEGAPVEPVLARSCCTPARTTWASSAPPSAACPRSTPRPSWSGATTRRFIEDVMRFLDNVLEDFIHRAPPEMKHAVYAARRERSVGLGLMGFHSFLQSQNVPFESAMAKSLEHAAVQAPAPRVRRGLPHAGRRARRPARTPPSAA